MKIEMGGTMSLAYTDKNKKQTKNKKPTHLITTVNNFNNKWIFLIDKNIEMRDLCFSSN